MFDDDIRQLVGLAASTRLKKAGTTKMARTGINLPNTLELNSRVTIIAKHTKSIPSAKEGSMCTNDIPAECAACGKGGDGLKTCTACKMVKYCGVACQKAHRPSHKKECRMRARELFDEALFKLPQKEDCPICFQPLPVITEETQYQACCGKILCFGCTHTILAATGPCPFCRNRLSSNEERNRSIEERTELGDRNAFYALGIGYMYGKCGFPIDRKKGFGLVLKAAELGLAEAHCSIASCYCDGLGVEMDRKKQKQHLEIAAIGGHVIAMYNLGAFEYNSGNYDRAKKHWMVAASAGYDIALTNIRKLFLAGHATKDEFETALRVHKDSADEMKSDQRDAAKDYLERTARMNLGGA